MKHYKISEEAKDIILNLQSAHCSKCTIFSCAGCSIDQIPYLIKECSCAAKKEEENE